MAKKLHYKFKTTPSLTGSDHPLPTSPDLTITRATTAMMKDSDGWIREVQSGEARFQGATFSHNLLTYSHDFSNAAWAKESSAGSTDPTIDANQTVSDPLGGTDASTLTFGDTTGAAGDYSIIKQTKAIGDYAPMRSVYVKANAAGDVGKTIHIYGSGANDNTAHVLTADWVRIDNDFTVSNTGDIRIGVLGTTFTGGVSQAAVTVDLYGAQWEDVSGAWDSDNQLVQSNSFDTTWTVTQASVASGVADPDGGTQAWGLTDTAVSTSHFLNNNVTIPEAGRYRISVNVKASNQDWILLYAVSLGGKTGGRYFNVSTGATGGTLGNAPVSSGVTDLGGGWYRCWIEHDFNSTDLSGAVRIYSADSDGGVTYLGGANEAVQIYEAQLERTKPNQTAAGTYTETTTAAVTNYSPSTYIATTTAVVSSLSGSNEGLIVEGSRTNLALNSEDITAWAGSSIAPVANQTIAPDGSLTADLLIDDAGTGSSSNVRANQGATVANSTAYTFSIFAKADQLSWLVLAANGFTTPSNPNARASFDLANGVVGTVGSEIDATGIEDYGNGWYRCWSSWTTDATDTTGNLYVHIADGDDDVTVDRDGTSSIFVWGAQFEAGIFPTSYIPTTSGSVTRNVDYVFNTTGADLTSFWGTGGEGSYYVDGFRYWSTTQTAGTGIFELFDDASNRIVHFANGVNSSFFMSTAGSTSFAQNAAIATYNQPTGGKAACAYATNDMIQYWNGVVCGTDTSQAIFTGALSRMAIGSFNIGSYWEGVIAEVAYHDTREDNATLDSWSTNGYPAVFGGTIASDGGHIWPPRASDPRWTQILTDSGITTSGSFIDDVHTALESLTNSTGALDNLWDKFKADNNVTDTSEPFTY